MHMQSEYLYGKIKDIIAIWICMEQKAFRWQAKSKMASGYKNRIEMNRSE